MATLRALSLLELNAGLFRLMPEAQEFLLKSGQNYFGYFWDMMYENSENFSLKNLESAIRKDRSQVYEEHALFDTHSHNADKARKFTHAMHSLSMGSASVWPTTLSLEQHRKALDIGGASGAHAIGMTAHWPHLMCTIFDLPEVCPLSADYIQQYGLTDRVSTHYGNMWHDDYPEADLHFYSNIFHDWPTEKNRFLTQKSYASLPKGGRIVIHEILYNDVEPGPLAAAAYSLMMLGWTEGQQYSGQEISSLLSQAGFKNIEIFPSLGYFSIVTAIKI